MYETVSVSIYEIRSKLSNSLKNLVKQRNPAIQKAKRGMDSARDALRDSTAPRSRSASGRDLSRAHTDTGAVRGELLAA